MTDTTNQKYHVGVIECAIAYYTVEAPDARTAAENWQHGEFYDRDDEALDSEGPCNVREQQPDGTWRMVPPPEWESEPPAACDPAAVRYIIHSAGEDGYWSNEAGWGGSRAATIFTASDQRDLRLPPGGRWAALKPYSVLLLYPDYLNDTGCETYYTFVDAKDPIAAVGVAQWQLGAAQEGIEIEPDDFMPLLVIAGHHASEPLFNK